MKKKLAAELISIAHKILQLKDTSDLTKLKEEARTLYEKLTVLSYVESQLQEPEQTIEKTEVSTSQTTTSASESNETKLAQEILPEEPVENIVESKPEIVIEEINAKVTEDLFIPATENTTPISAPVYEKNDLQDVGEEINQVASTETLNTIEQKPRSINDQLKKGIQIGLNDRLAFIKHLFDGSASDYNRVLSQLNTLHNKTEASEFIQNMIKPDYQGWDGKEEYEQRFMDLVLNKFEY